MRQDPLCLLLGGLAALACCLLLSVYSVVALSEPPGSLALRLIFVSLLSSLLALALLRGSRYPVLRLLGVGWGTAFLYDLLVYSAVDSSREGGLLAFAEVLDLLAIEVLGGLLVAAMFTPVWLFFRQRASRPSLDRASGLPWLALAISLFSLFPLMFAASRAFPEKEILDAVLFSRRNLWVGELLSWRPEALVLGLAALLVALVLFTFSLVRRRTRQRWLAAISSSSVSGWRLAPIQKTPEEESLPLFSSELAVPDQILFKRIENKQEAYRGENLEQPIARLSTRSNTKDSLLLAAIGVLSISCVGVLLNLSSPWSGLSSQTEVNLREVFGAGGVIFVGGDNGLLLRGTEHGNQWEISRDASYGQAPVTSIRGDANDLYAIAGSEILHSKDQGETWQSQTLYSEIAADIPGVGPYETLYLFEDGRMKSSSNNGASWKDATLPATVKGPLSFVVVRFVSAQEVYLGGPDALFVGSFAGGWSRVDYKRWAHKYKDNIADPTKLLWVSGDARKGAPYFYFLKTFQEQYATYTKKGKEQDANAAGVYALWISPSGEAHMPGASYQRDGVWGYGGQQASSSRFFLSRYSFSRPRSVWGDKRGMVISVYQNGLILLESDNTESEEYSGVDVDLNAVWVDDDGRFYAVGDHGVILRR